MFMLEFNFMEAQIRPWLINKGLSKKLASLFYFLESLSYQCLCFNVFRTNLNCIQNNNCFIFESFVYGFYKMIRFHVERNGLSTSCFLVSDKFQKWKTKS